MSLKKHIPNALTCSNLVCGAVAVLYASKNDFEVAFSFIVCGAVFDFFDGFAARLLGVSSPIGKELDSLADNITFGLAPATMVWAMMGACLPPDRHYLAYAAFIIAAFSALRLAKFNLDERQKMGFIGLPTPANALFWGAISIGANAWIKECDYGYLLLLAGALVSSWLLVSEIPMFALKFSTFGWKTNELRYSFLLASAVLIIVFGFTGLAWVVALYIALSLISDYRRQRGTA